MQKIKTRKKLQEGIAMLNSRINVISLKINVQNIQADVSEAKGSWQFNKSLMKEILDSNDFENEWCDINEKSYFLKDSKDILLLLALNICIFPYLIKKSDKLELISKYLAIIEASFKKYINSKGSDFFLIKEQIYNFLILSFYYESKFSGCFNEFYKKILNLYQSRCKEKSVCDKESAFLIDLEHSVSALVVIVEQKQFFLDAHSFLRRYAFLYPIELLGNFKGKFEVHKKEINSGKLNLFSLSNDPVQQQLEKFYQIYFIEMFLLQGPCRQSRMNEIFARAKELQKKISSDQSERYLCILVSMKIWQAAVSFVDKNFSFKSKRIS